MDKSPKHRYGKQVKGRYVWYSSIYRQANQDVKQYIIYGYVHLEVNVIFTKFLVIDINFMKVVTC